MTRKGPNLLRGPLWLARRLRRDERGGVFVLVAVLAVGLAAITSFVVDYGRVMNAQKELQTAADAAALAGAQDLPDGSAAVNTAFTYSATYGATKGNTRPDVPNPTFDAQAKCLNFLVQLGLPPCPAYNALKVTQEADVKLLFLGGIGIPGIHIHATSVAAMKGGAAYPLDVVIVLDRTGSMSGTKIQQARAGVQSFLGAMRPSSDLIGLDLFPPTNATSCNYSEPNHPYESAQNGYVVVHLRNDFRTSDTGPLNNSSPLVQAVSGNCPLAEGVTAYTTALHRAKEELNANGRANAQDVIIFFTDGEANYGPNVGSPPNNTPERQHPCQSAIDLVNSPFIDRPGAPPAGEPPAFIRGTWVYTILYATSSSKRCTAAISKPANWDRNHPSSPWDCLPTTSDTTFPDHSSSSTWRDPLSDPGYYCQEEPHITAQSALQSMASVGSDGQSRFYTSSDDLTDIFKRIALDLSSTRLLPDDTQ